MTTATELISRVKTMPNNPGIYLFYSERGDLIYVGRATSLRNRVYSYFRGKRLARPIEEMIHEVIKIDWLETDSVLEAVILESHYIKNYQPVYNVLGKDDKSWNYIAVTRDPYPKVYSIRDYDLKILERTRVNLKKEFADLFGPFPGLNMRAAQKILRQLFRFSDCEPGAKRPCLYYEMGQCLGICIGAITPEEYKKQVIRPLTWFLAGKKKAVIKDFEKRMKENAKHQHFEEAAALRNQLEKLKHIHDLTLIDRSFFENEIPASDKLIRRIEGYDISNLGPYDKVGSMVVFDERGPVKSGYRKFIVRSVAGQSDVDSLAEVMHRRLNHPEWPLPDLVLIDGGRPQLNRIKKVFNERKIVVPFIGIAKGRERKRNDFLLGTKDPSVVQWIARHRGLLIRVRDEAHRFAISFQRSKRKIK